MKLRINSIVTSILLLLFSCGETHQHQETVQERSLVTAFQTELDRLDHSAINSIDSATYLFQEFAKSSNFSKQRDSLFFPYFAYYNIGCELLLYEDTSLIEKYGFRKKSKDGKSFLDPSYSSYLNENIIQYLSKPMQEFCHQQLREFDDSTDIKTIARNALWWEEFNRQNPEFYLKEMAVYHYKNWHLSNLLKGTRDQMIFDEGGVLLEEVSEVYHEIITDHSESVTAKSVVEFLSILEKNGFQKTTESDSIVEILL